MPYRNIHIDSKKLLNFNVHKLRLFASRILSLKTQARSCLDVTPKVEEGWHRSKRLFLIRRLESL